MTSISQNFGFLTPARREFLLTSIEERSTKYQENKRAYDKKIRDHAKQAIKDLALVSCAMDKKQNKEIFTVDEMAALLKCIIRKQWNEKTHSGKYYQALIDAIASAANVESTSEEEQVLTIKYEFKPLVSGMLGGLDLTGPNQQSIKMTRKRLKL